MNVRSRRGQAESGTYASNVRHRPWSVGVFAKKKKTNLEYRRMRYKILTVFQLGEGTAFNRSRCSVTYFILTILSTLLIYGRAVYCWKGFAGRSSVYRRSHVSFSILSFLSLRWFIFVFVAMPLYCWYRVHMLPIFDNISYLLSGYKYEDRIYHDAVISYSEFYSFYSNMSIGILLCGRLRSQVPRIHIIVAMMIIPYISRRPTFSWYGAQWALFDQSIYIYTTKKCCHC